MYMLALAENKKAYFDYEILEKLEAGIELEGHEVKSLKTRGADLVGSFVIIRGGEVYVTGLTIIPYQIGNVPKNYDSQRTRRILLKKSEIRYLADKLHDKGLTLLLLKLYNKNRFIKAEVGLARRKKKADKRQRIKERETKRKIEREMKR